MQSQLVSITHQELSQTKTNAHQTQESPLSNNLLKMISFFHQCMKCKLKLKKKSAIEINRTEHV